MSKTLKNIGQVSFLTMVSRCLGLTRDLLSAGVFGASVAMDAFVTAFSLPNLFRRLLGEGALTAAFVPTLQEELHERGQAGAFALLSKVVSWLAMVTGGCVLVGMVIFGQSRLVSGPEAKWSWAADLTVILFPYLALVCLAAALSAALNVLGRFTESALSPIWLNVAMIASLGFAAKAVSENEVRAMYWLCAGVLVGGGLQMGVPALVLMRAGWRPRFDLELSPRVRTIAQLMVPGLLGTAIYQINIYVSRLLAFSVSDSSATLLFYANRLMELPIGVFAIAVATVVYPLIARHAVEQNFTAMAAAYHKGVRLILMINVPAAAGLALLSEPIVRWLFQHGKFTSPMTQTMAPLLMLFAVGMPFFSVASLTTRACYALKDMGAPVRMAAVSFAVNLGLSLLLMGPLAARGLVVASTLAVVVQTVLLQRALVKRMPGMRFGQLWLSLAKVGGATLAMGLVVAGLWFGLLQSGRVGRFADTLAIFVLIPIGAGVYGAMLWTLRIEGREDLAAIVAKLRSRFRFGGAS